ncbi:hypothetical protein BMS3Abin15_00194 [bacterium BMS3Abin15]|nr:hypothetical protein BMS3Abin15_00194 [bacterium BMS3Abin15]HDZ85752.1 hypothetical protein [Candidatus Moranbacteria bacterium]
MIKNEKKKYDYYYDAMDFLNDGETKTAKKLLQKALKLDGDFIDAYNGLVAVYEGEGNKKKAKECSELAYSKTRETFPNWPEEMHWGEIDNRQFLRAVCNKAIYLHEEEKFKEAEELYRLLLKLNPGDNQGVRYLLAALFAGKEPEIVEELTDKGNELQDWSEMEELLETQNKKHKFWNEETLETKK